MGYFDGPDEMDEVKESRGLLERLGEAAGKAVAQQQKNYEKAAKRGSHLSDERLIKEFKNEHDFARKRALGNELKNRGYGGSE